MKFILGKKGKMTQIYDEEGRVYPATVIKAGPLVITQVKTLETDGYDAIQIGSGVQKEKNINKAQKGHFKDLGAFKVSKEFRGDIDESKKGDTIDVTTFEIGDKVEVTAVSKGKGFQGVVKRHSFAGGPRTHGQKHSERRGGSIGATGPQRVLKGTKMAGRMGSDTVTVKNLKVLQVDKDTNTLVISGAIPGRPGTSVEIRG